MVERVVYVLGAGASHDAGGPLISDFFSKNAERNARIHAKYFSSNERFLALESAYKIWALDTDRPDIEKFFQRVDYQTLIGERFLSQVPARDLKPETLHRYLVWYIGAYVRNSIADQRKPPAYYRTFAKSLKRRGKRFALISFNYDLVFERAILTELKELDYKLGRIYGHKKFCNGVPLLKLHGSLNWLWCPKCEEIFVDNESVAHRYPRESCLSRCGGMRQPLIIPPSPQKGEHLKVIQTLWRNAEYLMEEADKIVIVGYSLPDADVAAKELLKDSVRTVDEFVVVTRSPRSLKSLEKKLGRKSDLPVPTPFAEYVLAVTS